MADRNAVMDEASKEDSRRTHYESNQDFYEIRSQCLAEGKLFEDPEFPADDSVVFKYKESDDEIVWLRPGEIAENPKLFFEGYSRFDVQQGYIGNCWLIAAMANLTLQKKLFFQVVPYDQSFDEDYAGVFHFRFWLYGRWVEVVIDDRLPTVNGSLTYLHSTANNEFWSALLEKAYAKFHGSYASLVGGFFFEAMEDFTGGISEVYYNVNLPENFYTILLKAFERNSLIGCSLTGTAEETETRNELGILRNHAYSITRVKLVELNTAYGPRPVQLLRLRNPWGENTEWKGIWSDESSLWKYVSEDEKKALGLKVDDDGEFWMSYKDFVSTFTSVEICHLMPDSFDLNESPEGRDKKWITSEYEGAWVPGETAGGCINYTDTYARNPQYTVTLTEVDGSDDENKCTLIVSLTQSHRRRQGLQDLSIGFDVYQVPEEGYPMPLDIDFLLTNPSVGEQRPYTFLRETTARFRVDPGMYVIIPSTYFPDQEGEYLLRVFSETDNNMAEV